MREKKIGYFRSYNYDKDAKPINLCEHLEIKGKLMNNDDGCEYVETIEIICKICKNKFILSECIN